WGCGGLDAPATLLSVVMQFDPLTLALAFGAGILSFISPCCVPLVPAYLGYMTGMTVEEMREASAQARRRLFSLGLWFVLGLAVVFTVLGASASAMGQLLLDFRPLILKIGGLLIILFGLHLTGLLRIPLLLREKRAEVSSFGNGGPGGAFLMGGAFALGWTPCIGPMLAAILTVASQATTVYQGMALLFVYALGLGVPFVLAGILFSRWSALLKAFRRHAVGFSYGSGLLMIGLGVLMFSGRLALISAWATRTFGLGLAL
ncbi:MAG: sulfite exporter TauE/SafE family protein, partial [Chloroflexota bacterium]|nr:sulfite exporter TauE/SafE family protein [Chloroflexota bacterium]